MALLLWGSVALLLIVGFVFSFCAVPLSCVVVPLGSGLEGAQSRSIYVACFAAANQPILYKF